MVLVLAGPWVGKQLNRFIGECVKGAIPFWGGGTSLRGCVG